jgi:tetratricopeptide (TPR) repeat protein
VPIDRAATLRKAEKLLRQGKLEQSLAEYLRVLEDQPADWTTANLVGDLYARMGQVDRAAEQYMRIGDNLKAHGLASKAIALYKKVLRMTPNHERALLQAAEVAAAQGLIADARTYLNAASERYRGRGHERGMAEIKIRLGALDPSDYPARLAAARARGVAGDVSGAMQAFRDVAADLVAGNRAREATDVLREAIAFNPRDLGVRDHLLDVQLGAGDIEGALAWASAPDHFLAISARFEKGGDADRAITVLRQGLSLQPGDAGLMAKLALLLVGRGDLLGAAPFLTAETGVRDAPLLLAVAAALMDSGRLEEGVSFATRALEQDPSRENDIVSLASRVGGTSRDVGRQLVALAVGLALGRGDAPAAARALEEFLASLPDDVPTLMRLIEVCADGGLEADVYRAQGLLADAYLALGSVGDARLVAEDLLMRASWDRSNEDRLRRVLQASGEQRPDAVIAAIRERHALSAELERLAMSTPDPVGGSAAGAQSSRRGDARQRETGHEVDLSALLDEIDLPSFEVAPPGVALTREELAGALIERRDVAPTRRQAEDASQHYSRGRSFYDAGQLDQAVEALREAVRAPAVRFGAASLLATIYRQQGRVAEAIEWLERAAEAHQPDPQSRHGLLYELADALESSGETARALAVCLELQADAGSYRDVAVRIQRLTRLQVGR